jgi:hypothetical protein
MTDKGVYVQLWKKYLPVIRLLLKKTDKGGEQKLQLYKHEFEKTGAKNKLGYIFSMELVNGKPATKIDQKAVAFDLLTVMNENEEIVQWLKEKHVSINTTRSCELIFQQKEKAAPAEEQVAVASS